MLGAYTPPWILINDTYLCMRRYSSRSQCPNGVRLPLLDMHALGRNLCATVAALSYFALHGLALEASRSSDREVDASCLSSLELDRKEETIHAKHEGSS